MFTTQSHISFHHPIFGPLYPSLPHPPPSFPSGNHHTVVSVCECLFLLFVHLLLSVLYPLASVFILWDPSHINFSPTPDLRLNVPFLRRHHLPYWKLWLAFIYIPLHFQSPLPCSGGFPYYLSLTHMLDNCLIFIMGSALLDLTPMETGWFEKKCIYWFFFF